MSKQNEYCRNHYLKNKDQYRKRNRRRKLEKKIEHSLLKESRPCMDCLHWPYYVMHFDHARGDKTFNISRKYGDLGKEKLGDELGKCDLVCANCHAVRTHMRSSSSIG